jgi:uncharacterized membrane protein
MTARGFNAVLYFAMAVTAVGTAMYAARYLTLDPEAFSFVVQRASFAQHHTALFIHIASGALALVLGLIQFFSPIRRAAPALHRATGYFYVASVLASAGAGAWLAPFSHGAPVSSFGFGALAILWPAATLMAAAQARRAQINAHQAWMIRSYAMTFAAVTLRAEFGLLIFVGGLRLEDAYQIAAWSSWSLNLIFAEWVLIRLRKSAKHAPAS